MKQEGRSCLPNQQGFFTSFKPVKLFSSLISLITICVCFLGLGAFNQTLATNYYVDNSITDTNPASATPDCTNYNTGTFTCSGGSASAYKTIADINAGSFSGDNQILFRRGQTWREQVNVTWSGSSGNPITFVDYGSGALPVFHGGTIIPSGSWSGPDGNGVYTHVYWDGRRLPLSEDNTILPYALGPTLSDGNWYTDGSYPYTMYYKPTSGTPSNHTTDIGSGRNCIEFSSGNNSFITIRNLKFFLCFNGILGDATNASLHDIIIENSQFYSNNYLTIRLRGANGHGTNNNTFRNNSIYNGNESIFVGAASDGPEKSTYLLIENNKIYDTGYMVGTQSWSLINIEADQEAIDLQNIADSTISGNEINRGTGNAIVF